MNSLSHYAKVKHYSHHSEEIDDLKVFFAHITLLSVDLCGGALLSGCEPAQFKNQKATLSPCCAIILCLEWMMEWFYFGCVSDASEMAQENKDVSSAWGALNNHQAKVLPPKIFLGRHFLVQTKLGSWHLIVGASGLGVMPQKTLLAYLYYDFKTKTHSYYLHSNTNCNITPKKFRLVIIPY